MSNFRNHLLLSRRIARRGSTLLEDTQLKQPVTRKSKEMRFGIPGQTLEIQIRIWPD